MNGNKILMKLRPMSISEICKQLNINRDTFFQWIDGKALWPYRRGHRLKFRSKNNDELPQKSAL